MAREEYIRIYRSDVAGATPSLTSGEIAANLVDGKLFVGGTNGSLIQFTTDSYSVTGVNGLTGNVSITGDGGAVYGVNNNTIAARVAGYSATGFAAFNSTFFDVGSTGLVSLTGVYVDANGVSGSLQSLSYHEGTTSSVSLSIPVRTNLIKHTQDYVTQEFELWNAYGNGGTPTITNLGNATTNNWPNGSTGGIQLAFAANSNNGIYQKWPTGTLQTNTIYTLSCWARSSSGTEKARFSYFDAATNVSYFSEDFTLTTVPQRVSYTFRTRSANITSNIAFGNGSGSATGTVLTWGFQLEEGSVPTSLIPNSTGEAKQGNAQVVSIDLTKTVVTGDGAAIQGKGDAFITARVATESVTGVASFNSTYYSVSAQGLVTPTAAFQVTGQTVVAGYGIDLVSSGNTRTINNRGVTSFNGLTGNVSLTGDGGAVQGKLNNTITTRLTTAAGATGLASFRDTHFLVDVTGHVQLAAAYQVTGQTVVAGYGIDLVANGNTRTINNRGVTSFNGLTGNVSLTGDGGAVQGKQNNSITVRVVSDNAMTGIASFDASHFAVGSSGHVRSKGVMTINGVAPTDGNFAIAAATVVTGDGGAIQGKGNAFITARVATDAVTGVASFNSTHFTVTTDGQVSAKSILINDGFGSNGSIALGNPTGTLTLTGSTIAVALQGANTLLFENRGVHSFNGLTGIVSLTGDGGAVQGKLNNTITTRLTTAAGATGLASFRDTHFLVDATGHVQLAAAYQVTGQTVVAGYGIDLVTSGNTRTINNRGVTSFNGLTGNVSLTGDGGAVQGKLNNTITTRLTTAAGATGLASFRDTYFLVDVTGHVQLAAAYQVTGQTVVAGYGIDLVASGNTRTINNRGVTSFNGLTGNVSLTGDGGAVQGKLNNTITTRLTTAAGATGLASFRDTYFLVDVTGHVQLAAAYQVTGQTVVAGYGIDLVSSGNTRTINNRGVTSFNGLTGNVSLTGDGGAVQGKLNNTITVRVVSDNAMTGIASFDASHFAVGSSGHIRSKGVMTINGVAPTDGNFTIAAATVVTGDGGAIQGKGNAFITARVATSSLTGVAAFNDTHFSINEETGYVSLLNAYDPTYVAFKNASNVFTSKQYFTAGISAADSVYVGSGLTSIELAYRAVGDSFEDPTKYTVIKANDRNGMYLLSSNGGATASSILLTSGGIALGHNTQGGFATVSIGNAIVDELVSVPLTNYNSRIVMTAYDTTNGSGTFTLRTPTSLGSAVDLTLPSGSGTLALTRNLVSSFNGLTGIVSLTGDGGAVQGKLNNRITVRVVGDNAMTGVASFDASHFAVGSTGHVRSKGVMTINGVAPTDGNFTIGAATVVTGDGAAIQGKGDAFITARVATSSLTGVASFSNTYFSVVDGAVSLASAYQVTGQTVVAGYGIDLVSSGNTRTINNRGVTSFNGLTGNVSLTGDGGAVQGKLNNTITTRLTTAAGATGLASFRNTHFLVDATGHVQLASAYQVTGQTVVAGYGINLVSSGNTRTINNRGVTAFNGLTGNVSLTGDGGAVEGKENDKVTARLATYSLTGVAYFDSSAFIVTDGYVQLNGGGPADCTQYTDEATCLANGCVWCSTTQTCVDQFCSLFSVKNNGIGVSANADGSLAYLYFDAGNLTYGSTTTIDPVNDFVLFYDSSQAGLIKTKRIKAERILLDNDTVFNSKSSQFVKSKSSTNIEFEVLTAPVTANETKLLKSGDAFTYISQNTVKSLNGATGDVTVVGNINGCTGAIVITGTTNEVVVSNSCPNITIGLPDNVSIPYLSGTGATFTQTVTANRFIGTVSGGDF